ncbi:MAG TPA: YceI family protein, partial [bacterium]|nr:YceI family protein [bacterium]
MRRAALSLAAAVILAAGGAQAAGYSIDPQHSSLNFKVKHLSISYVMGKFSKFSGTFSFDPAHAEKSKVSVTIDPASVDTGETARDNDLRSDHFFEVATYPTATFTSTKVTPLVDGKFQIMGKLTLHGVTKPVTLDAVYDGA